MNPTSVFGERGGFSLYASRLSPRLPQIATWVLVVLIAVQAALIASSFFGEPVIEPVAGTPLAVAPVRRPVDVQGIVNAHLFGEASAKDDASVNPEEAPHTTLTLVLAGTIAVSDPKKGLGIIGETAANAKVYPVGESIPGGATLHAVYLDRVILERAGSLEALLLPRQQPGASGAVARASAAGPASRQQPSAAVERVRQLIARDPGSVAEIMRPQPVFSNGQQRGYRVYPGRNRQQFQQLGLQPGDLVTAINGTPLDDPARGMEIFRSIGSSPQVRVSIERKGRQQDLTLNMAQLADQATQSLGGAGGTVPMNQPQPAPDEPVEE